jgi:high affinity sulfate transporter 1
MIGNSIVKVMSSDPTLQPCLNLGSQQNNGSDSCFSNHDDIMAGDGSTPFGGVMSSNEDEVPNITAEVCDAERATIAITIAMLSGVIMLLMGLLQLGFISIFLSESLVSGYTTGAACHVFTSQLKHVLGIDNGVHPGILQVPRIWIKSIYQLCHTNPATFIIALVTMAVLIAINILNKWLKKRKIPMVSYSRGQRKFSVKRVKWTIPVPGPLVVLIGATLISFLASFETNFDVIIVGEIPQGAPALTNPFTSYISFPLIIDSFVISIVVYSVSVSLARKFANEHDYAIHSNQEFIAYGAMNVIGSFFSSFTAAGSLSRSLIQSNAGKTQLVGFISSAIILIVLLWLGALFEPLPTAVLAATIWVALWGMFRQFRHTWSYFKLSFSDFLIWVVVFLATVFLGVDLGLGVGVAFSLLVIIFRIVLPYSSVLGQAKDTEIFRNTKYFEVDTVKGVLIFRFMAPICFMNAAVFRTRLEMECDLHKRQKPGGEEKGCLQKCLPPPEQWCGGRGGYDVTEVHTEEELQGHLETASDRDLRVAPRAKRKQLVHSVVIDCAPISFLDAVGVNALKQLVLDFYKCDVQVVFASMTKENRDMMDRAKFYEVCGKEWLFPSIQDAVHHACFSSTLVRRTPIIHVHVHVQYMCYGRFSNTPKSDSIFTHYIVPVTLN